MPADLEQLELDLLLEAIFRHHGFDFRQYARASVLRRVGNRVRAERLETITGLQERLLHDADCMERLLLELSVNTTAIFRDPGFYLALRKFVVPRLKTYPFVRIWHAGCSTGEEVHSLAILMKEEGLHDRCRIYATDMNEAVIKRARDGIYPLSAMKEYTQNYQRAGGKEDFSRYYTARYDHAIFDAGLRDNVVFSQHNLATDGSFNEFALILCRNVMIYFDETLQGRVHGLLYDSLCPLGLLCLGTKESLLGSQHAEDYLALDARQKIFRRRA